MSLGLVLRLFFLAGFVFLVGVGMWAIVVITRMKREQTVAIALLDAIAAQAGLRRAVDRLASGKVESVGRGTLGKEPEEP